MTLNVGALAQVATGTVQQAQATRLGAARVAFLENPGFEMGRSGRSVCAATTLVAGGVVPVVDLPTTTGPCVVYNAEPSGGKLFHVKRIGAFLASGTMGAFGMGIFAGVTPVPLATALVANGATNFRTQATRGYGSVSIYIDVAKTIGAGTCWQIIGGCTNANASAVTGPALSFDVASFGFVVAPTYALTVGVLGDTGTTAKYGFCIAGDMIEGDLP